MFNKNEDFKGMKHNPFDCRGGQRMWQRYPDMARHKALREVPEITNKSIGTFEPDEKDLDLLIRFVVLFAEPFGNPIGNIKDFDQRMELALEYAGISKSGNSVYFFISSDHWWYRSILFEYFRMINNDMFNLWFSLKTNFNTRMHLLRSPLPVSADEKYANMVNKLTDSAETLLKKIQEIESKLFKDERLKQIITEEAVATDAHAEMYAEDYIVTEL